MTEKNNRIGACVGIAAIISAISCSMIALFAIFSPDNLANAGWVVGPLCFMGLGLGSLATLRT